MCDLPGGRRRHPQGRSQRARLPGWCVGVENVGGLLALSAFSCTLRAAFVSSREIRCTVTGSRHISRNFSLRQSKAYFSKDFEKSTFAPNRSPPRTGWCLALPEGGCIALYDVWRVWLYGCMCCMCCIRCISEEPERGGRHTNELDWTRISSTWGWVSSLRSPRLQSQTCSLDCN